MCDLEYWKQRAEVAEKKLEVLMPMHIKMREYADAIILAEKIRRGEIKASP